MPSVAATLPKDTAQQPSPAQPESPVLFADHPYKDHYWQALIDAAHNRYDQAHAVVNALSCQRPMQQAPAWQPDKPANIDHFFDKIFLSYASRNPQLLTYLGLFNSLGIKDHDAELNDVSLHSMMLAKQEQKTLLKQLDDYDSSTLSTDQQLSKDIIGWALRHDVEGERFLLHGYNIHQLEGVVIDLISLLTKYHVIKTETDVQHYRARLSKIPQQLDQSIAFLEEQKKQNILVPRCALEKVIGMIDSFLPAQVKENLLYTHIAQEMKQLCLANPQEALDSIEQLLATQVYPAFNRLHSYLTRRLAITDTNRGVWAHPDGDAYYAHMLKYHTTTSVTPAQVHEIGIKEVAHIHKQVRDIFAQLGYKSDTVSIADIYGTISKNPSFYYTNDAQGRAQAIAQYEAILERSRKELGPLFNIKPSYGVTIKAVPEHEQDGMPGAYYSCPSFDGSRPGTFYANLRDMNEVPTYGMETLTIHEAEPGHHFQMTLQQEMPLPIMRKLSSCTAYIEGWALYTEKLAFEQGFYSSPYAQLGHLRDELLRAARLVVDTGLHHKRWTREQAIDYMQEATGMHRNSVITEVERYLVLPGQACSYKIGQLKILELRKRAHDALQDRFDIKEFHDLVLKTAAVPLDILEKVVDEYIAGKK